ncbi:CmcJ/NvfI family oxidoreductase [Acuticoccus mangrovi]|nr:CmcJ/NvfI family oxidoreductase [Acuticoccus mangrovi]
MIEAEIAFLAPCDRRPIFHDKPSDEDFLPLIQHSVPIRAVHDERTAFTLDRHGVEIVHRADLPAYQSAGDGRTAYLRALEDVVTRTTGATEAMALGNGVVRRSERSTRHRRDGTTVLGRFAHCDFSPAAAGSRFWVEHLLPAEEARQRLTRRYAIYNVWRCLTDPPQDTPLAFCEPASMAPADVVGCDQMISTDDGSTICFELSLYHYSPAQRWFYFPDLRRGDLLIFTGCDSDRARPQGIAHAAFTDPSCPDDVPARESIDERVIAFFD